IPDPQNRLVFPAVEQGTAGGAMPIGRLRRAALRDPEVELIGIKIVVARIGDRRRRAALELQQRGCEALGGTGWIELPGDRPYRGDVAPQHAKGVDLMRDLIEQDAA